MTKTILRTMALAAVIAAGQNVVFAQKASGPSQTVVVNDATQAVPVKTVFGETFSAGVGANILGTDVWVNVNATTVPVGKRLVIEHVSGYCQTSSASTSILPFLATWATNGGSTYVEFDTASKPWGSLVRHTFSKRVHIEIAGGDAAGFRIFRSDVASPVFCGGTITGQLYNAQ